MAEDLWCKFAIRNPASAGLWGPTLSWEKIVLHTTEASGPFRPQSGTYFGHTGYPHFTVDELGVYQHIPINRGSRALRHPSGTPHTNFDGAIQIEIQWRAAEAHLLPSNIYAKVRGLLLWIGAKTGIPLVSTVPFHVYPPPVRLGREPWRLSWDEWDAYRGVLGHQHVPGNTHGDPGNIDLTKLLVFPDLAPDRQDDMTDAQAAQLTRVTEDVKNIRAALRKISPQIDGLVRSSGEIAADLSAHLADAGITVDPEAIRDALDGMTLSAGE